MGNIGNSGDLTEVLENPGRRSAVTIDEPPPESRNGNGFPPHVRVQEVGVGTVRRHFLNSFFRWCGLLVADFALLLGLRSVLTLLRESALWTGSLEFLYPEGFLGGGDAIAAIILGLVFAKAYGSGEGWRSGRRMFWGAAIGVGLASWRFLPELGAVVAASRWVAAVIPLGVALVLWRKLLDWGVSVYAERFGSPQRVILVGNPNLPAARRAERALRNGTRTYTVGWLTDDAKAEARLGHPSRVWDALAEAHADIVILCGDVGDKVFSTVVEASFVAGCRVLSAPRHPRLSKVDPKPTRVHGLDVMELTFPSFDGGQKFVKRLVDIVAAAGGLVILSPLFAVIAAAIRLDSSGPVFFRQKRVGFAGEVFKMLKFRTMRCGADEEKNTVAHLNHTGDSRLFKIPDDPRVTSVGRFLRRWSLDELPQLINVLKGDMSLVGPRPFFPDDLRNYRDHHFMRLAAKPGITGMWQVFGRSDIVDFEEVVRLDCEYINRWNLFLDLKLLFLTIPAVFRREGAY